MPEKILFPEIADELKSMRDEDQAARAASMSSDDWSPVEAIDAHNTKRLREIIATIGWPSIPKVGEEGATHAWLIAQHADQEPAFQQHCLDLMKQCPAEEVSATDIAFLEDRILSFAGKPQIYGTQFVRKGKEGAYEPYPISDLATVNQRRAAIGLESLEAYSAQINRRYPSQDKAASEGISG